MQVNINSDNHVDLKDELVRQFQTDISEALNRFSDWITRVEVHLTDENSRAKGGSDDIRCLMEARPASKQPVSIEVRAASVEQYKKERIPWSGDSAASSTRPARKHGKNSDAAPVAIAMPPSGWLFMTCQGSVMSK